MGVTKSYPPVMRCISMHSVLNLVNEYLFTKFFLWVWIFY